MPQFLQWFLRFSIFNPICWRLIGTASRRRKDLYLRSGYVAILATVLFFGLLILPTVSRFSLRDLAAGSANIFVLLSVLQLLLIWLLTPIFMASAITKEANPKTWDILLSTPLSPLQIVLGNLFGRLFFITALLIGALPLMVATQFFGGVSIETILLTQLVAFCLAFTIASAAIAMSVTRTAGRKAAVSFFIITVIYILGTYAIDLFLRLPVSVGASATWTTVLTPLNPFLVLEALFQPAQYVTLESSNLPWPLSWISMNPVIGWCSLTIVISTCTIILSALQVRKLGQKQIGDNWLKQLFSAKTSEHTSRTVTGNPIAWRERATSRQNIGSVLSRWGFVGVCTLGLIILITLYTTKALSPDTFRTSILFLVCGELLIVTFSAISISASAITKEREDGTLDLLLTTSITPILYLSGKVRGLVMHLLPMVLVPCITMMSVGALVLIDQNNAIVSDKLIANSQYSNEISIPLALAVPAILTPFVVIPYIAFCLTLGLLWSMRSKGSVGAIVATLILIFVVTSGLGICLVPSSSMGVVGSLFAALSPINLLFTTLSPATTLPELLSNGVLRANIEFGISTIIAGGVWTLISIGLLRSMSSSFVVTVRRLAGVN
ncbi:MAG: ABC transporter permease subunit [Phycisphaerae bacterium]|jgi:ABC-type transport system involved in multi-copper enzyme maturation permease subunit|nr:ABC transporter permease subunit [Phycisphaerae bacterium]MBT6283070.1 ABC transporter permease subunit [Phycisphaerae bacterium]